MDYARFIVSGEDKNTLSDIKNTLVRSGHVYIGYLREPVNLIRTVRRYTPNLIIISVSNDFNSFRQTLEVINEELLAACIVLSDFHNNEAAEFLHNLKNTVYLVKPIISEALPQIINLSLSNFSRVQDYERRITKLNEMFENRKVIEKAKWILVEQEKYSESEAYDLIRKKSRENRISMKEIAEAIIFTRKSD